MLASIHPLGERARGNRWGVTAGAYLAGSALGGVVAGVLAGALGLAVRGTGLVGRPAALVAAGLAVLAAGFEGRRLPGPRRQVDEDWMHRYRGWVYGSGFGLQLGLGVVTIVTTPAVYLALALAVLSGSLTAGAAIGLTFGVARALPLLLAARIHEPAQLRALHRTLSAREGEVRRWSVAALAAAGAALVASGVLHG